MLVKVYNWSVTLFYFYITYRGIVLIFFECDEHKYKSIIYQYGFENKHKYLSIWVSFLQTIYFMLVSSLDIISCFPSISKCPGWSTHLSALKHYLLTSLVLPLTMYIFVVFWSFYIYNREAIYPELFDRFIPPWLNYAMHFYPVPIVVIHLVISPNVNPSRHSALLGITLLFVIYGIVFFSSVMKGNWVYLLFNNLSLIQRMIVLSISYPMAILFLIFSRWLNSSVNCMKTKYLSRGKKEN